jgi:peptidoglycan/xylan/chitin deacetylase (PgdA/CDA1 family)
MAVPIKQLAKRLAYRTGALGLWHRWTNRRRLTVLTFHRVLPEGDPRWKDADPTWTVSSRLFAQCLAFLRRHYHFIGAADMLDFVEKGRALPARPLLITFDDGWADNEQCALEILRRCGAPAVIFVATGGIGQRELWHERLLSDWRQDRLSESQKETLRTVEGANGMETREEILLLLGKVSAMREPDRGKLVQKLSTPEDGPPLMVDQQQLLRLERNGVAIGAHGVTHTPLTHTPAYQSELRESRSRLSGILEASPEGGPVLFSFPHGRYTPALIEEARAIGYKFLFTSDARLNTEADIRRGIVGRISIDAKDISGSDGSLRPELLAFHLFSRQAPPCAGISAGAAD